MKRWPIAEWSYTHRTTRLTYATASGRRSSDAAASSAAVGGRGEVAADADGERAGGERVVHVLTRDRAGSRAFRVQPRLQTARARRASASTTSRSATSV